MSMTLNRSWAGTKEKTCCQTVSGSTRSPSSGGIPARVKHPGLIPFIVLGKSQEACFGQGPLLYLKARMALDGRSKEREGEDSEAAGTEEEDESRDRQLPDL